MRAMINLWERMGEIYGFQKWTAGYGEIGGRAFETWSMALYRYGADGLKRGFEACMGLSTAWPPSLGEFAELCKPKQQMYQAFPALPDNRTKDPAVAEAELSKMRRILGMNN